MSPFDFAQVFMTKQHLVIRWKQMTKMNTFHLQCQYQGLFQPLHAAFPTSQALPHEGPPSKISPKYECQKCTTATPNHSTASTLPNLWQIQMKYVQS